MAYWFDLGEGVVPLSIFLLLKNISYVQITFEKQGI